MQLISSERDRMLSYLLIKREGSIFDLIAQKLESHSVALLAFDLLQIQIKPEPVYSTSKDTNLFKTMSGNQWKQQMSITHDSSDDFEPTPQVEPLSPA
jgi:hypothetical protein